MYTFRLCTFEIGLTSEVRSQNVRIAPSSGKSIRLGLMARHTRPDDPSGSA